MKSLKNNTHFKRIQTSSEVAYQETDLTGTATTEYWDVSGFEGFRFIASIGNINAATTEPVVAAGTIDVKLQSCGTATGTYSDVTGASCTQLTSTDDDKIIIIEVDRPISRYYKAVITAGGTGGNIEGAFVELFGINGNNTRSSDSRTKSNTVVVNV